MLETAPSFSIYSNTTEDGNETLVTAENGINETVKGSSGDFSFAKPNMELIKEEVEEPESRDEVVIGGELDPPNPPMYLASGLGIDHGVHVETEVSEEYCRELLDKYPNHPLVLSKYAQLLQVKGDLQGAEEYYFRATQADPRDGEILVQYAKVVWENHHDPERAVTYFELAAQTAPDDSNVLAAYAKFLWEIEVDEEDNQEETPQKFDPFHPADGSGIGSDDLTGGSDEPTFDVGGSNVSVDIESYYKRMVEENPSHPIFLKKYAEFLYQSKGDLQGAEGYYSRAVLADPQDGEMLSQYATLIWELYHDQDKTLSYLERAIEAAPQDSNVLAAYARILWAIDDE